MKKIERKRKVKKIEEKEKWIDWLTAHPSLWQSYDFWRSGFDVSLVFSFIRSHTLSLLLLSLLIYCLYSFLYWCTFHTILRLMLFYALCLSNIPHSYYLLFWYSYYGRFILFCMAAGITDTGKEKWKIWDAFKLKSEIGEEKNITFADFGVEKSRKKWKKNIIWVLSSGDLIYVNSNKIIIKGCLKTWIVVKKKIRKKEKGKKEGRKIGQRKKNGMTMEVRWECKLTYTRRIVEKSSCTRHLNHVGALMQCISDNYWWLR